MPEAEPQNDKERLESILAADVRLYLGAFGRGDEAERLQLRSICTALEYLLGALLQENAKWSRYKWVDGVLPSSAAAESQEHLTVQGVMIWGERKRPGMWVEPFFASVRVQNGSDGELSYRIMCGDVAQGLGKAPYRITPARHKDWAAPGEWLFVFSK